jgi:uncharacterized membrane protein YfcA
VAVVDTGRDSGSYILHAFALSGARIAGAAAACRVAVCRNGGDAMIAWLIGIITLILLIFMIWRWRSREARERFEQPKFQFLRNLGVAPQIHQQKSKTDNSREKKHAKRNS